MCLPWSVLACGSIIRPTFNVWSPAIMPPALLLLLQKKLAVMRDNSLQSLATLTDLHCLVWRRALAH